MDATTSHRIARRLSWTVFVSVALGMVALYAAFTAAPLVAEDLTGSRTWSGLPGAAAILGTAAGTAGLSVVMSRRGRRPGLVLGWTVGGLGAIAAILAIQSASLPSFIAAMVILGIGHGANQLARFAAADPHPMERRGTILSLVVWAGTVGAVVGPNVLDPTAAIAESMGMAPLAGGYITAAAAFALAMAVTLITLRPDPAELARVTPGSAGSQMRGWDRRTLVAVAALVTAQFVMILIMTMTPVHIRGHEHGLAVVGGVMSAHFAAMFALAPIAGRAADRFGPLQVALAGLILVVVAGVLAAVAPAASVSTLGVALLLLGLGWSAAFVASSTLLMRTSVVLQGRADAMGWVFAALASVSSGVLIASVGYVAMCLIGVTIAAITAVIVLLEVRRPVVVA
jgi:MFS family permease